MTPEEQVKTIDNLQALRAKEILALELEANKQDLITQLEQKNIFMADFHATDLVDRCDKFIEYVTKGVELS